jgi:hypothetical protein
VPSSIMWGNSSSDCGRGSTDKEIAMEWWKEDEDAESGLLRVGCIDLNLLYDM